MQSIANDEMNHVKFLRTVLGKDAVKCPQVDIGPAFAVAADAAANTTLKPPFSPYAKCVLFYSFYSSHMRSIWIIRACSSAWCFVQGSPDVGSACVAATCSSSTAPSSLRTLV